MGRVLARYRPLEAAGSALLNWLAPPPGHSLALLAHGMPPGMLPGMFHHRLCTAELLRTLANPSTVLARNCCR